MDALLASAVVNALVRRSREKFTPPPPAPSSEPSPPPAFSPSPFAPQFGSFSNKTTGGFDWFSFVLSALISAIAIYLSWSCNTALKYGTAEKVVYAAGAGLFGTLYLVYYVLFRGDTCRAAK